MLPGISGSLVPSRFLMTTFGLVGPGHELDATRRHFLGWWQRVERHCGPATGLRALFDFVAMPLAGLLGYRAHDARFSPDVVHVRLSSPGGADVTLMLLPWASRPSQSSRLLWPNDAPAGAASRPWCLLVAPPFVSLAHARPHTLRRRMDFTLPYALDARSFAAFWALCSADAQQPAEAPAIYQLVERALRFQDVVRRDLQHGVITALDALGPVMGNRPAEPLTLVYRVLFLLFAESRRLVPQDEPAFRDSYAVSALCREAVESQGAASGLWDSLAAITRISRAGCDTADLIIRPFNGRLFARASAPSLESGPARGRPTRRSRTRDAALGRALAALGSRPGPGGREEISYADLGVEQLGAVYERVLDLDPESLQRKETGTFYTPQPLAELVIRRTLGPLVRGVTSDQILSLRVVDPAMGSGAFLVAACRYLTDAYARALVDEGRCSVSDLDPHERAGIRRLIAGRCLAGVDVNPTAVQLARLSLWLTTLAKDKPLSFLDHQLRVGHSLIGASPEDLWRIPSTGRRAAPAEMPLFDGSELDAALRHLAGPWRALRERADDSVSDVRARERLWDRISGDRSPVGAWRAACDLWCARWFWPAQSARDRPPSAAELRATLDAVLRRDRTLGASHVAGWIALGRRIAKDRGFFHWPLEFPDVFYDAEGAPRQQPGFDAVIGNPPWEMLRRDGGRDRDDAPASLVAFVRQSGLYPSCDRGQMNLYQPFLERSLALTRPGGRLGLVLPWGLAADAGAAGLRARLLDGGSLDSLIGFDNADGLFPIHRGLRFLVVTASPGSPPRQIRARFGVRRADEIDAIPADDDSGPTQFPIRLSPSLVRQIGGASARIPDLRRPEQLAWLQSIVSKYPALGSPAGWNARFGRELNATEDREHFGSSGLTVIEGKHIAPFRASTDATTRRIPPAAATRLLPRKPFDHPRLAYRDVSGVGNRQALIAAVVPAHVVTTHTLFCLKTPLPIEQQHFLCGLFNSPALNAIVRLFMSGHVTTGLVEDLPVPVWTGSASQQRLAELAQRLSATAEPADSPGCAEALSEISLIASQFYCLEAFDGTCVPCIH